MAFKYNQLSVFIVRCRQIAAPIDRFPGWRVVVAVSPAKFLPFQTLSLPDQNEGCRLNQSLINEENEVKQGRRLMFIRFQQRK